MFPYWTLSRTLVLHLIAIWPWKPMSPIWYAQLTLNSVALVPSAICPQMLQRLLCLPLFSQQTTEGSEQRCLPCSESFLNGPHFSSSCFSSLVAHRFEDTVQILLSVIIASTRLLLTTWLNSWESTSQPANFAHLLILLFSVFPLYAHTRLVKGHFLTLRQQSEHYPLWNQVIQQSLKTYLFQQSYWLCECVLGGGGRVRERERETERENKWSITNCERFFFLTYFVSSCNGPCAPKKWHRKEHITIIII